MTLLTETELAIKNTKHVPGHITFIGSADGVYSCSWLQFVKLADFSYDPGFGAQKVASDLVIMFSDGLVMSRHEYDGSECWSYNRPINVQIPGKPIVNLCVDQIGAIGWRTLEALNG